MTRRVVTGHRDGKGTVLYDGQAPNRRLRQASGLVSTLVWATESTTYRLEGPGLSREDALALARSLRAGP